MKPTNLSVFGVLLLTMSVCTGVHAQQTLNYEQYMKNVKSKNISYIAQKYNLTIAKANEHAAHVFQDPSLSITAGDNQNNTLKMGQNIGVGINYNLELGGKRHARIQLAKTQSIMTDALLDAYFYQLQADATLVYLTALKQKQINQVQQSSYALMLQLAQSDSIRFSLGEIQQLDAQQSLLEAKSSYNDLLQAQADYENALTKLGVMQGDTLLQSIDSLSEQLSYLKRSYQVQDLIAQAQNHRADIQVALLSKEVSKDNLNLARASRMFDLGLSLSYTHNIEAQNEMAPSPAYNALSVGVSLPLQFSNLNKGTLNAAKLGVEQSELQYQAMELQIQSEVMQAYTNYQASSKQVEAYDKQLLGTAKDILEKKIYSYQRGESSLLEVLDAKRTYDDLQQSYYQTLYNCAAALVELERSTQMWDIVL